MVAQNHDSQLLPVDSLRRVVVERRGCERAHVGPVQRPRGRVSLVVTSVTVVVFAVLRV